MPSACPRRIRRAWFGHVFTNSLIVAAIVAVIVLVFARRATAKMELVPDARQPEHFRSHHRGALRHARRHRRAATWSPRRSRCWRRCFFSSWLPIGSACCPAWERSASATRARSAALPANIWMPRCCVPPTPTSTSRSGMALVFMVFWAIWSFQELGVGGFFRHIFGPKGDVQGWPEISADRRSSRSSA